MKEWLPYILFYITSRTQKKNFYFQRIGYEGAKKKHDRIFTVVNLVDGTRIYTYVCNWYRLGWVFGPRTYLSVWLPRKDRVNLLET